MSEPEPATAMQRGRADRLAAVCANWCAAGARFALTTHVRPDCDALGSVLAMDIDSQAAGQRGRWS